MQDLDYTIEGWLAKLENGKLPRGDDERIEAFMILLKTLKQNGYDKSGLSLVRSKVIIECTNPTVGPKKLAIWKNILEKQFNKAVVRIWPEQFAELTEEEKNPEKFKLTPSTPKPDKIEEDIRPEETPRMGREITPAMLDRVEKPIVIYNEDFDKLIGIDSDE